MTIEQIKSNDHIPTLEILEDIKITQIEIDDLKTQLSGMPLTPEYKTKRYFAEGDISMREKFIMNLNKILNYRNVNG